MAVQKTNIDFQLLFESAPDLYLVLSADKDFTIVGVNNAYASATMTNRDDILYKGLFEVFPDNPNDISADGVSNLRASLNSVVKNKSAHTMDLQKYDIRKPNGEFEKRYWSPQNKPVLDSKNNVLYIIHRVEDVTELVRAEQKSKEEARLNRLEIEEKVMFIKSNEERINNISDILLKYTLMDFSQQISISEKGDEMDAIAVGLNTMGEELQSYIGQLKESEERIKTSQKIFSTVFYKSPVLNTITDGTTGQFIEVNDNFIEFIGYTKEELIGKTSSELNLIPDVDQRNKMIESIIKNSYSHNVLLEMRSKNGELKWVSTSSHKLMINNSESILSAMIDVTERKKAEDQLVAVNKELEAFSYSVSHDLRAPLRAVNGYAQMLNEDYGIKLDDEGKRIIETIRFNATRMGRLIDDLLSFSRLGRKEVHKALIDMDQLLKLMIAETDESLISEAKIKIGKLHEVKADYGLMQHVMFNLVSNAIKYTSKTKNPVIEISSEEKDNEIIFSVKDNGAGFDMRYYDKLFGVFQRLHTQDEFEGTGVGLAIVQRIITKHGGKVWAEGKIGEGATFNFSLNKN